MRTLFVRDEREVAVEKGGDRLAYLRHPQASAASEVERCITV
jgi:hypothetical protein